MFRKSAQSGNCKKGRRFWLRPACPARPLLKGFICQFSVSSLLIMGKYSKEKMVAEFEVSAFGRVTNIGQICSKCFQVLFWPLRLLFCRLSVARIRLSLFRISTSFLVPVRKYPALVIWAVVLWFYKCLSLGEEGWKHELGVARKRRILLQWRLNDDKEAYIISLLGCLPFNSCLKQLAGPLASILLSIQVELNGHENIHRVSF